MSVNFAFSSAIVILITISSLGSTLFFSNKSTEFYANMFPKNDEIYSVYN